MDRWLGAGRLDTSRGSRFMRAEADVDARPGDVVQATVPAADGQAASSVDGRGSSPAVDRAALVDAMPTGAERQIRAALSPAESHRNVS
jgi:hypothetical protein